MTVSDTELIARATAVVNPRGISDLIKVGGVGSALVTDKGNVYTGVCIETGCSMGFCAEHAAISSMITAGESKIVSIVAIDWDGKVLSPCGRCREFIYQVGSQTRVLLSNGRVLGIKDLLPEHWRSEATSVTTN